MTSFEFGKLGGCLGEAGTDAVFRRCIALLTGFFQISLSDRIFLIRQKK